MSCTAAYGSDTKMDSLFSTILWNCAKTHRTDDTSRKRAGARRAHNATEAQRAAADSEYARNPRVMNQSAFGCAEAHVSHHRTAENETDVVRPHGERGSEVRP